MGGGAGSVVRFATGQLFTRLAVKGAFPWPTLVSNLLATGLLAWLVLRFNVLAPGKEHWRALLAIGFCGGWSTFSALSLENFQLLRDGFFGLAALNIIVSVAVGIALFYLIARTS